MCSHNLTESIHFNHNLRVGFFFYNRTLKVRILYIKLKGREEVRGGGCTLQSAREEHFRGRRFIFMTLMYMKALIRFMAIPCDLRKSCACAVMRARCSK